MSTSTEDGSLELWLHNLTAEVLDVDPEDLDSTKSFIALGGDSLSAIEYMAKCRDRQVWIEISDMMGESNLSQLINRIVQSSQQNNRTTAAESTTLQNGSEEQTGSNEAMHSSQTVGLKLTGQIPVSAAKSALDAVIRRHHILQSPLNKKVERNSLGSNLATNGGSNHSWPFEEVVEDIEEAVSRLCGRLHPVDGPGFGAVLHCPPGRTQILVLAASSTVIDQTSWRIIIQDFSAFLRHTVGPRPASDIDFSTSISMINSLSCLRTSGQSGIYEDVTAPNGTIAQQESWEPEDVTVSLERPTTEMILYGSVHKVLRTTATDIFNAALLLAAIELELANGHAYIRHVSNGRHGQPESSDTVGCFDETTSFELEPAATFGLDPDPVKVLREVKDLAAGLTARSGILNSSDGGGNTKNIIAGAKPALDASSHSLYLDVCSTDTLQVSQSEHSGLEMPPSAAWAWLTRRSATIVASNSIQIVIRIRNGRLNLSVHKNTATLGDNARCRRFVLAAQRHILKLLEELEKAPVAATLCDFPLMDVSYTALDGIFAKLQALRLDPLEAVQAIGPCSPMQDNFLVSQRMAPQSYQCRFIVRITPAASGCELDLESVKASWTRITARHAILRTTFMESDIRLGKFDQVVWKHGDPWVTTHDNFAAILNDTELPIHAPYQPPHRFSIAPAPEGGVYVKLDISHALVDGQSTEVLMRDFCRACYGKLPEVEALGYLEFTAIELGLNTSPTSLYWSQYMNNAQATYLPVQSSIDKSGLESIQARMDLPPGHMGVFCGRYGVTPVNVCQVAWGLVLRAFTNSDDVCFSYVTSRRQTPLSGIQDAVGLFIDVLFCRLNLNDSIPAKELLPRVSEDFMQGLPYQNITAALAKDPNGISARQWGNTVLSFHRVLPAREFAKAGLSFELVARTMPTDYDVSLNIDIDEDAILINLDFWNSKMSRSLAGSILGVFKEAIKFVLERAHEPVLAFSPLTEADKDGLRRSCELELTRTNQCVHDLVQVMATRQPQSPAVCAWDGDWTYEELVASAAALSQELIEEELINPEARVGICMEKSRWAVTAMLAVLQSGAAVVPVGVDDPRAGELLKDASITLVLASSTTSKRLQAMRFRTVVIDDGIRNFSNLPTPNARASSLCVAPDSVAWILYTSGSSGKPKGVILEHTALSTALLEQGKAFHNGPGVRTLQFAAFTFADSIPDIFGTLIMGGCVCMPSEEDRTTDLAAVMHKLKVNQATLTSTVAGLLLDPAETPTLNRLILSGEVPSSAVVSKWMPHTQVINGYGQSEAAVFASCSQPIKDAADSSCIGHPITGRFWVVHPDDYQRLCPVGGPGELLIESQALARGYLGDVEKSTSVFVDTPQFLQDIGISTKLLPRRMYRTGDLVLQSGPNGAFVFLGRQDTQVKIRGQRVELGEIESAIAPLLPQDTFGAVTVSLIKLHDQNQTEPKLVAALELTPTTVISSGREDIRTVGPAELPPELTQIMETLRDTLLEKLPVHMVPTFFVPMTRLPVNASKKIDRRTLRSLLEATDPTRLRGYVLVDAAQQQPRTEVERQLQSLWAVAFRRSSESISIKEHFFQAGGDSITAVRMVAAARNVGVTLTVADIFKHTRIVDLAKVLSENMPRAFIEDDPRPFTLCKGDGDLPTIAAQCDVGPSQIEDVYPCTPLQEGLMAITTQRSRADAYVLQRCYRISNGVALEGFRAAWENLVACTPILRTRIALTPRGVAVQVVVKEPVRWHHTDGYDLPSYLQQVNSMPIEYGRPLSRVALVNGNHRGDGSVYFVWTIHHSLYDGWSTVKTLDLLGRLWAGQQPPPAAVPMSRFIRYLAEQDETATRDFWLDHLEGAKNHPFPALPHMQHEPLPTEKAERRMKIKADRKGMTTTTSTILRATWAILLASYSANQDAVMMVTLSGRNAPVAGIVDLIAPTLTSVPFRVPVPNGQPLKEFLEEVQRRTTSMIPFEHTGLQHIRRIVPGLGAQFDPGHVFTIQTSPQPEARDQVPPLAERLEQIGSDRDGLQSYALTMDCIIDQEQTCVTLEARFDANILTRMQVESILGQFDFVFGQLSQVRQGDLEQSVIQTKGRHRIIADLDLASREDLACVRGMRTQRQVVADQVDVALEAQENMVKSENAASKAEQQLRQIWSEALNLPLRDVPFDRPFVSLGGDSIAGIRVVVLCRAQGVKLSLRNVLHCRSIADLTLHSSLTPDKNVEVSSHSESLSSEVGNFGLSPFQEMCFHHLAAGDGNKETDTLQYSQSVCLRLQRTVTFSDLCHACEALVTKHGMLRARFYLDEAAGWQQRIEDMIPGSYAIASHRLDSDDDIVSLVKVTQRKLDASKGPVFAVNFCEVPGQPQMLSLVAHQAVVDRESWRIIVRDLDLLLTGSGWQKEDVKLHSNWFRTWCQHYLKQQSRLSRQKSALARPQDIGTPAADWEYWNLDAAHHAVSRMSTVTVEVAENPTSLLLGKANEAFRSQPQDILLAALLHSFHSVFPDRKSPSVLDQGSHRELWDWRGDAQLQLSDTVGCFTTATTLNVSVTEDGDENIAATIREIKDRRRLAALERAPSGVTSQLGSTNGDDEKRDVMAAEITFEFGQRSLISQQDVHNMGVLHEHDSDQLETMSVGRTSQAATVMKVSANVLANNRLKTDLSFNNGSRFNDLLRRWMAVYAELLEKVVYYLIALPRSATPSDFLTANLTLEDIKALSEPSSGIDLGDVEDVLPCAPIQQGILLSQLKSPASYGILQTFLLRPARDSKQQVVNVQRLMQAWRQLQARHSIMRTVFVDMLPNQEEFHQVVLRSPEADVRLETPPDDRDPVQCLAAVETMEEIQGRPPHRLTILQARSGEVFGRIETTHALIDAASFEILTRELLEIYDSVVPTNPGSTYGTYISYLRQRPTEDDLKFWTNLLSDASPCILPSFSLKEDVASKVDEEDVAFRDAPFVSTVLNDLSGLRSFQESQRVTAATVFELAWALILASYTGSHRVCWGGLFNGRDIHLADADQMVGPMISQTIHFVPLEMDSTVGEAARDVQRRLLDAFEHQNSSLAAIQHALDNKNRALFNTLMSYRRRGNHSTATFAKQRSLVLEPIETIDPTEYDITLQVITDNETRELEVVVQYSPKFINSAAASRILDHFLEVVQMLVESPSRPVRDLVRPSGKDLARIQSWNNKVNVSKVEKCTHQLIQQRLQMQPDKVVVDAWDGTLTARELDDVSSRLAGHLDDSVQVLPDQLVGFCMSKSKWAVVAMLGILKSGGAVVPLGVQDPPLRIETIIRSSGTKIIVADKEQVSRLGALKAQEVCFVVVQDVCRSARLPESLSNSHHTPTSAATFSSNNIAFVMHTSGSTGTPKGVVVDHGSLSSSMKAWVENPHVGFGPDARIFQFTAFTFDPANHEVLSGLYSGGCVCVPSEHDRMNDMEKFIRDFRITTATLTPSVARMMTPEQLPSLQTLALLGEAVKPSDVQHWLERGSAQLVNAYGPTECTIIVSVSRPITAKDEAPVIGYPLGGVALWVTQPNDFNYLCPVGVSGELLIEGHLVATGYLHDAKQTASSFVTDAAFVRQLGPRSGRRMYRTGDIVRQNQDGSLTYVERRDNQVKLHGQRVEVSDIENWILRLAAPGMVQMVYVGLITPSNERSEEARLVAAVQVGGNEDVALEKNPSTSLLIQLDALRRSLLGVLPSYMVPSVILPFERIALTSAGKVDRPTVQRILGNLDEADLNVYLATASATSSKSLPSSATERMLQGLWSAVLRKPSESIGGQDNFFQIGGDSISAMKLVAAARRAEPPVFLTVASIFRHPCLSELARVAEGEDKSSSIMPVALVDAAPFTLSFGSSSILPGQIASIADQCKVAAEDIEDVYPCAPLQEGLMAITTRRPDKYVLQRVFSLNGDVSFFKTIWQKLWGTTAMLRTRIVPWDTGAVQVVIREPVHWQSSTSVEAYLEEDRHVPMTYGTSLCRICIIETPGNERRQVALTMHHSIYDGWSMVKTMALLAHLAQGAPVPRPVPISRFVRYLVDRDESAARSFWRKHLGSANVIKFPELPVDPSYLPQSTQHAKRHITKGSKDSLGSVTTSNVLRAAWAILLATYAGTDADEAIIMVVLSGRQAPVEGILDILGPTVATVPVRIQIPQSESIPKFLARVQQDAVEMIQHEHTGLQNIRRYVPELDDGLFTPAHLFTVQAAVEADDGMSRSSANDLLTAIDVATENGDAIQGYAFNMECKLITDEQIEVDIWFDETTISPSQVHRILEQFENIFQQLSRSSKDESRLVRDLSLISPEDQDQILSWNGAVPERTNQCIHEILQDVAARQPEAPAICAWDGDLTYRELLNTASRLARHLHRLDDGVGPEALLGLCMSKSKWALVAIIAILQAGAGVVPLGIGHPVARIQTIVENTRARFILTDSEQADRLNSLSVPTIVIDDELIDTLPLSDISAFSCSTVTADNTSFVVFTSGSTGTPKGSVLEHGALASSLLKHSRMLRLTARSRALQFAAFTFDNSISDIFATLFQGGCVCEPSEDDRVSNLAKAVWDLGVNFLSLTPTVAALLRPQDVPPIDTLVVGGEPLDPNVIDIWGKSSAIINSYGPSECSILVACSRPLVERRDAPNVGLPVACCFWVVSPTDYNRLCPIGAPGELLLQGPQLGRGYINEPEKTAKAFVMNPRWVESFPSARNHRLYRSGDLVRQNSDQSLTMLGRRDTQVKIHGQRVEIGEVESWIVRLMPDVRKAAVDYIALTHGRGDRVLVAALELEPAVATAKNIPVQVAETSLVLRRMLEKLRTDLRVVLPSYMIPMIFLPVTRLPLNPSSKLDRMALRAVFASLCEDDWNSHLFSHVSPKSVETEAELLLRQLWSTALSLTETLIGRDDNLFDLGGDSVVAMRLTAMARDVGLQLTVADIFRNPVLEQMASAASITSAASTLNRYQRFSMLDQSAKLIVLETVERCPWVQAAGAEVLDVATVTDFQALSVAGLFSDSRMDLNYIGVDGNGDFDVDKLRCACLTLIEQVESLRTAFVRDGSRQYWQVILDSYQPEIRDYSVHDDDDINAFTERFIQQDIFGNPEQGKPPLDIAIIAAVDNKHRILFRMSHALYDAHSLPLIWDTLAAIFHGTAFTPAPTFTSYLSDFCTRTNEPSLSYWREFLQGSAIPLLGRSQATKKELKAFELPKETILLPTSLTSGMMPAVIVKAAWGMVLAERSGLSDVTFAEASTGRNAVSPTVAGAYGCCVTALPFRFVVPHDAIISELLDRVRQQQTKSIQHETVGTRRIIDTCTTWDRFTSLINHQRAQQSGFVLGETKYTPAFVPHMGGFYMMTDITITATQGPASLGISLAYAVDVVPKDLAVCLLRDLLVAIEAITQEPNAHVSSISEAVRAHTLAGNVNEF